LGIARIELAFGILTDAPKAKVKKQASGLIDGAQNSVIADLYILSP
jgi:hypothetical protein